MNALGSLADTLLVFTLLITLGYIASCALWPFKACRRCEGLGQIAGPFGGIRLCRHCDATGLRLRIGRRIWNSFHRLYRDIKNHRNR